MTVLSIQIPVKAKLMFYSKIKISMGRCRVPFFPLLFFGIRHIFGAVMISNSHQFNIVFRI